MRSSSSPPVRRATGISGSYLREVPEAEASGTVAEVYAEIREALGLPFVALVYRHLAACPGRLEGAWAQVGANLRTRAVDAAADELLEAAAARAGEITRGTLAAIGVGENELASARATLAAYAFANPRNLLAVTALLHGAPGDRPAEPAAPRTPMAARLLPMAELASVVLETRALLHEVAAPFAGPGEALLVPSLFRHFAHRPALLALLWSALRPLVEGRELARRANLVGEVARTAARELPVAVRRIEEPDTREALERFAHTIPRMTVAAAALASALPEPRTLR